MTTRAQRDCRARVVAWPALGRSAARVLVAPARAAAVALVALVVASLQIGLAPARAAAQSVAPPELTDAFAREARDRSRLVLHVSRLDQATGDGLLALLAAAFDEPDADDLFGPVAALVHVAGRDVPAGLSAARDADRRAHRAAVRVVLAERLAGDRAPELLAFFERLLARPAASGAVDERAAPTRDAAPTSVLPLTRECAACAAGALGAYALAPRLAGLLDVPGEQATGVAARGALHALYGRWFSGRAAFQALWPRLEGKGPADLFLDELAQREAESAARLLSLVEARPDEVLAEAFAEPDPELRARVAGALGAAVGAGTLAPGEAWQQLRQRLAVESSSVAAYANVRALLELVQGTPGDDVRVVDLRRALDEIAARDVPGLDAIVLRVLPRVPWQAADGTPAAAERDLALASQLLRRAADGLRPLDPDRLVLGLNAYGTIARRVEDAVRRRAVIDGVPEALRALVEGRHGASPRVRAAAADALAAMLSADDLDVLLDLVRALDESGVRYKLLGVLADAAPLVTDPDARARVANVVLGAAEGQDAAVRARAIELLADERLDAARAAARASGAAFDGRIVELLRGQLAPPERIALLDVLAGSGRPALLEQLMRADTMRPLATGPPRVLDALTRTLRTLAAGDAETLWTAAGLLTIDLPGAEEEDRPSRPRRVAAALDLVLSLSAEDVAVLAPERHAEVVGWFLELRAPGSEAADVALDLDAAERARLSEVHARAALELRPEAPGPRVLEALLALDGLGAAPTPARLAGTIASFDAAIEASRSDGDAAGAVRLVLERARLALASGRIAMAEADLALVLAEAPDLLAGRDLRALAELALGAARPARALAALELLVASPAWRERPAEGRLADLDQLAAAARATADPAVLVRVHAYFEGLPPLPADESQVASEEGAPDGAVWRGLAAAGRAEHARLVALAASLEPPSTPDGDEVAGGGGR